MKRLFFSTILAILSLACFAQDIIVKKDGSTIMAKVIKISSSEVEYKKWNRQDGPTYTINTSEMLAINYPDGEKETFNTSSEFALKQNLVQNEPVCIEKKASIDNSQLISIYNATYNKTKRIKEKDKLAKNAALIYGVKGNSVLSNEDIEISMFRESNYSPIGGNPTYYIYISIKNKTDKPIYIDKANCTRSMNGEFLYSYFEGKEQYTENSQISSGGSLNMGAVTNIMGIGGALGSLANGVNIGGSSSQTLSKTYLENRFLIIPPKGSKILAETVRAKIKNGNMFSGANYLKIKSADSFSLNGDNINIKEINLNRGEIRYFTEENSPVTNDFLIMYSSVPDFSNYSKICFSTYLHEMIGYSLSSEYQIDIPSFVIEGLHDNSLAGELY